MFAYRRALGAGRPVPVRRAGRSRALLRVLTIGWLAGRLTGRRIGVLVVKEGPAHFEPMADLCVAGDVGIYVDRTFALDEVPEALATRRRGSGARQGRRRHRLIAVTGERRTFPDTASGRDRERGQGLALVASGRGLDRHRPGPGDPGATRCRDDLDQVVAGMVLPVPVG